MNFEGVRELFRALPGVEEGTSYGTPGFRVRRKFLARLKEDGETLVVRIGFERRDMLMQSNPDVFFITDHYRGYPSILVRLPLVDPRELEDLIGDAWREAAARGPRGDSPRRQTGPGSGDDPA